MNGVGGIVAWRWLFIIEGIPSGERRLIPSERHIASLTSSNSYRGNPCLLLDAKLSRKCEMAHGSREGNSTATPFCRKQFTWVSEFLLVKGFSKFIAPTGKPRSTGRMQKRPSKTSDSGCTTLHISRQEVELLPYHCSLPSLLLASDTATSKHSSSPSHLTLWRMSSRSEWHSGLISSICVDYSRVLVSAPPQSPLSSLVSIRRIQYRITFLHEGHY